MSVPRDAVLAAIVARRGQGRVTCAIHSNGGIADPIRLADAVAIAHGFRALGHGWWSIDRDRALSVAVDVLHYDLAYRHPIMPRQDANELAAGFVGLVGDARACFTNGSWSEAPEVLPNGVERGASWDSISKATFDAGVICVGTAETAILWVEDED